jgi:hypothetical protein
MLQELDRELAAMERAEEETLHAQVSGMLQNMAVDVTAPLPTQGQQSLELHSAILAHVKKQGSGKQEFMRRRQRRKMDRKQKKALEYAEKQESREMRRKLQKKPNGSRQRSNLPVPAQSVRANKQ